MVIFIILFLCTYKLPKNERRKIILIIYLFYYRICFLFSFYMVKNSESEIKNQGQYEYYKTNLFYNFSTCMTSIQGVLCFFIFGGRILYRYSYFKRYLLIKRYKKNEKKALNDGGKLIMENCQIVETLNQYDDNSYDSKNTKINIISVILFQMVINLLFILFLYFINICFFFYFILLNNINSLNKKNLKIKIYLLLLLSLIFSFFCIKYKR